MLEFIPANLLKKRFEVFGHFYSVILNSGEKIDCRSVLEIVTRQNKPPCVCSLLKASPDAIFIMMNPGSSKPLEEANNIISENLIHQLEVSLVPTKPDTTQYQVMRVMHFCGWHHVRVLNISDMRDPKSGNFVERFRDIERRTGFSAHSLFTDFRTVELRRKLNKKLDSPIVCAWGVSPDLDPLIETCLNAVPSAVRTAGLKKPNTVNKYFHPLPTMQKDKEKWVTNLVALIRSEADAVK
ncbi:MAG: hypothetical protein WCK54_17885 [Desulfuromonadales bacterium]